MLPAIPLSTVQYTIDFDVPKKGVDYLRLLTTMHSHTPSTKTPFFFVDATAMIDALIGDYAMI